MSKQNPSSPLPPPPLPTGSKANQRSGCSTVGMYPLSPKAHTLMRKSFPTTHVMLTWLCLLS